MDNERTENLLNEIKEASSLYSYIHKYNIDFPKLTLANFIDLVLQKKKLLKSEVVKNSGLHRIYAYQIISGQKKPSRDKLIALAFGLTLNLEEAQKMMTLAKFNPLYPKNKRDSIIIFALCNKLKVMEANFLLMDNEEAPLE